MLRSRFFKTSLGFLILCLVLTACQSGIPKNALVLSREAIENRQFQTRVFQTHDENFLLSAGAAVLQDSGFQLDEVEPRLGVIVASRDRDVMDTGEVLLSLCLAFLGVQRPIAHKQKVLASLVVKPIGDKRIAVRITFQHMVWSTDNQLIKNECLNKPEIFEEFFVKLSKSVFLVAQGI